MPSRRAKKSPGPLGRLAPWSWALEPVRGCNLRCGHCATRLFERGKTQFVTDETWAALWGVIRAVSPTTRVEMANAGEPTMHPALPRLLRIARRLSPGSQIQITTNGTRLASGEVTYRELFSSGANIVYVDMYAPREKHVELARASGYSFYEYHDKPEGAPGAWEYRSPHLKLIVLMDQPFAWPDSRKRLGRLGTFLNHMDWPAAKRFGLTPVTEPPRRRCTQPFRYVSVHVDGGYELCCQDFMGETAGRWGSVADGVPGFLRFWLGRDMQWIRARLREADRAAVSECSRCAITFSRCDIPMWDEESLSRWWDGESWRPMEPEAAGKTTPPPGK